MNFSFTSNTFLKTIIFILFLITLQSCGLYKPVDARKVSPNDEERIKKNMEEGKGLSTGKLFGGGNGGTFQFSSSNEMWRATLDILDFIPLSDVDYGGGIIITDWYSSPTDKKESLKIMVQFLTNEIRADGIKVLIYKKKCQTETSCESLVSKTDLNGEIKLAILKKAALIKRKDLEKNN